MRLTKFDTLESLIEFLKTNPLWISGFVDGEGCFTGSFVIDKRSTWGLQPQAEFNIVQNNVDRLLLEASNEHVGNSLKTRDQFLKLALAPGLEPKGPRGPRFLKN
jgi:hypothetical protein